MPSLNRVVMKKESRDWILSLGPEKLDVLELSGKWGKVFPFRSYRFASRWEFDPCRGPMLGTDEKIVRFDLIMANQVWEHLDRPYAATRNILRMLRPGGWFWVAVPFFAPFHGAPVDCSRWTARGLKNLLVEAGFDPDRVQSHQWGNRHVAARNLEVPWPPELREDDDLTDDPDCPVVTWAMAQKGGSQ
jgi:SAM-dependent methyltransferase